MGSRLNLDYTLSLASRIGPLAGVEERQLRAQLPKINAAHASLLAAGDQGWPHIRSLVEPPLEGARAWAAARREQGAPIIVVGEPGALAAARALVGTSGRPLAARWVDGLDAVDPGLGGPGHVLALGGPAWVGTVVDDLRAVATGITVVGERPDHGLAEADHLSGPVDARFGIFGPAALALCELAGLSADPLIEDALATTRRIAAPGLYDNPAYLWAALLHAGRERGLERIHLVLPSARLAPWADWATRAWTSLTSRAETLGGVRAHIGFGATWSRLGDEAALQHVLGGPRDVAVVVLGVEQGGAADAAGQRRWSLGRDLLAAVVQQLAREARPVIQLRCPSLEVPAIAALSSLTLHAALTLAILQDIDPLATPAVTLWRSLVSSELLSHR